jgi:antitoxin HigA-1
MSKASDILRLEFIEPLQLSDAAAADRMRLPIATAVGVIEGTIRIDADIAEKLGDAFGTTTKFWFNLQDASDRFEAEVKELLEENKNLRSQAW